MKSKFFLIGLLGFLLLFGCEKEPVINEEPENNVVPDPEEPKEGEQLIVKALFSGFVQKGPFINGSSVMIYELNNARPNGSQLFNEHRKQHRRF